MKTITRCLMMSLVFLASASCAKEPVVSVSVKNTTDLNREKETVEICWKQLAGKMKGVSQNNVVVYDAAGQELPRQVIFKGTEQPVSLIFQASVQPNAESVYTVKIGQPSEYPSQAFGRFIPERKDDYAWENNLVAHRIYGPALEATGEISNGIDVWVKKTDELLINEWYRTGDYHKDHGKGMDCYKVGRTLGAGALAPYVDGKIVLANNYTNQQTLDCGPLRISFRLDYAPFKVGEADVTESRVISLDANSRFNRIEDTFAGASDMEVAAGIVTRPQSGDTLMDAAAGLAGYWEPQNNDNKENNGHTAIGVIFPDGARSVEAKEGHVFAIGNYKAGQPFVYYMGTGWSKGGVESAEAWFAMMKDEKVKLENPLEVKVLNK